MNKLDVTNLRLKFPQEKSFIFKDLSLSIAQGEKTLLLGPSGCGKSTLLQVLSGIIPNSIEVPLKYDNLTLSKSFGFVFQDPDTQFCMPYVDEELAFVLENLNVPREKMDELIAGVLNQVGLTDILLHTSIHSLSQGMKQRLALASVLLLDPDVIFLDEPSALLDPEGSVQMWDTIKSVSVDKTVVIVEHKIDHIVNWVDRVVLFNHDGEIIANDLPQTIFDDYKEEFYQYGIWYPRVWDDYILSDSYLKIVKERSKESDPSLQPLLELDDFTGYHGKSPEVHVDEAKVQSGDWITISGDNGAGKSTLLLSLMHLLKSSGSYTIKGKKINLDQKKLTPSKELSLVFQNPELQFITNSVWDEVAFSYETRELSHEAITTMVSSLLKTFQLDKLKDNHPFQLSIGQKRRLSVATGFAQGASALLLDEPTFGQDAQNTFVMLELLEQLRTSGTTIVMVTHDINIVDHFATKRWNIDKGQLISATPVKKELETNA